MLCVLIILSDLISRREMEETGLKRKERKGPVKLLDMLATSLVSLGGCNLVVFRLCG